uniref:Uncharacterized protein n=1 Tax=Aegilops tauschii subsp. strangulata TaxID=200361 RepID=A0A453SV85_AEGTS
PSVPFTAGRRPLNTKTPWRSESPTQVDEIGSTSKAVQMVEIPLVQLWLAGAAVGRVRAPEPRRAAPRQVGRRNRSRETVRSYAEAMHELIVDVAGKVAASLGLEGHPFEDRRASSASTSTTTRTTPWAPQACRSTRTPASSPCSRRTTTSAASRCWTPPPTSSSASTPSPARSSSTSTTSIRRGATGGCTP